MKKVIKVLLWVVGILLALVLLLSLLAGPIAKGVVNSNGEKFIGRQMHLDHAGVNLFSGHVNLRGLEVYEADGTTPFAGFDTLDVRSVVLSGLNVNVLQDGEEFNFSSMLDHFKSDPDKEKDTTPSEWVIRLGDLRLSHAHATYHDLGRGKEWRLADLNLRVPGFVIGGQEATQAGLNLELADGGRLNLNTDYDAASNDFVANVQLTGFALRNVKEYLEDNLRIGDLAGTLDARIKAAGNVSEVMQSHFSGNVSLDGINLTDVQGVSVAALKKLSVDITDVNLDANRFAFGTVTLDGLAMRYDQWDDGNTMSRLKAKKQQPQTAKATKEEPTEPKAKKPEMQLTVENLKVSDCSLTYNDHTLPYDFSFPVTALGIEATNITTSGNNNARLRATLPGGGSLGVGWKGNISHWQTYQDLWLSIKGLDMKQLSPIILAYTGYPMEDGVFGLTSRLAINNSQLDNENKIDIYKATVGDRRKDIEPRQKIPLKAALYVLKDKDDKILVEMPVKGNVADPEFNYMKTVWKTLGNLLVKVATSPARAIAGAMGMTEEQLEFIAVEPNQRSLTSEQYHTLSALASIVNADSLLTLNLELHTTDTSHASRLNRHVRDYLKEQGVGESRFNVTTGTAPAEGEPTGYSVSSELKLED